jgi:hypothetical protein
MKTIITTGTVILSCITAAQGSSLQLQGASLLSFSTIDAATARHFVLSARDRRADYRCFVFSFESANPTYWLETVSHEYLQFGSLRVAPGVFMQQNRSLRDLGLALDLGARMGRLTFAAPAYYSAGQGVFVPFFRVTDASGFGLEGNYQRRESLHNLSLGPTVKTRFGDATVRFSYLCPVQGVQDHQLRIYASFPVK